MSARRRPGLVVLLGTVLVLGVAAGAAAISVNRVAYDGKGDPPPRPEHVDSYAVMTEWADRRAEAFEAADATALDELYAEQSPLAQQDRQVLARYQRRGVSLLGMVVEVDSLRVVKQEPDQLVLLVASRTRGSLASSDSQLWRLPVGAERCRRWAFEKTADRWQVASITWATGCPASSAALR